MKNLIALMLSSVLVFSSTFAQDKELKEEARKEKLKLSAIVKFKAQVEVITEILDQENEVGKPVVSSSTKRSLLRYMRSIQRYLEQKRYSNVESQMDSLYNYRVPEIVSDELKKIGKIVDGIVKEAKETQIKAGENLYRKVIDSTRKNLSQDEIDNLKDEINDLRQEMSKSSSRDMTIRRISEKLEKASRFLGYWEVISSASSSGDYSQAIRKLEDLISNYSSYNILPTKVLRAKIGILRKEANKAYEVEIATMKKALDKAKDSKSVKKLIIKFQVFQNKYSRTRGMRNTARYNEMNYTQKALNYWLNVITSEESGDYQQAIQNLNNLESGYYRDTLLLKWPKIKAKKELLVKKMLTTPKTDDPIVSAVDEKIKKCKDIEGLIALKTKLQELINRYSSNRSQELYYLQNDLQSLATIFNAYKSGLYGQVFQYMNYHGRQNQTHRWLSLIQKQRDLIRLKSIAAIADVDLEELQKKNVPTNKILLGMADAFAEKRNWAKVILLLDAYAMAFFPNSRQPVWLQGEINGCKSFINGQNSERADLLGQAVQHYIQVIQQTGKRLPMEEAIQRLKVLKKSNPELFDTKKLDKILGP